MSLGLKATLFAGAITLSAFAPAFAAAPLITNLPDVTVGDLEDYAGATDTNIFVFSDAFAFADYVVDTDTTSSQLEWSFGEFDGGLGTGQYRINGKVAVNQGTQAILDDEADGHINAVAPGPNVTINETFDTASFRDVALSPLPEQSAYDDPTTTEALAAEEGKFIRYYVSDGDNVDYFDAFIQSVDDANDALTSATDGYQEEEREGDFISDDWKDSGLPWEAVTNDKEPGALKITVHPTQGKSRIFGWKNDALLPYEEVGADKFVRGKFYIYTDVNILAPVNQVPNFRLRLTHEGAVNAAVHYELAATGISDPGHEPFYGNANNPDAEGASFWFKPADNQISPTPSLYRVDFDPVDVPAAAGSNIGALMESYAVADTANGSLYLTEVVLATYNALNNTGELEFEYNRVDGVDEATNAGGTKEFTGGGFNHEASLVPGYLQDLYFQGVDEGGYFKFADEGVNGLVGDTDEVNNDVFGVGLIHLEAVNNIDKLRVEPGKLYHARFYATAPVPTDSDDPNVESQGAIRFRFQTINNTISYLLDMTTLAAGSIENEATPNGNEIARQALPGIGSENPDTDPLIVTPGEDGGWYSVVVASPVDNFAIRNDVQVFFDTPNNLFDAEPLFGPGSGDEGNSPRDVRLGVDFIQGPATVETAVGTLNFARPNRAVVRLSAVEVYSYPSINDGGFDIAPTTTHPGTPPPAE